MNDANLPDFVVEQTQAMRAIVVDGWVVGAMVAVLLAATTWMYRKQTA